MRKDLYWFFLTILLLQCILKFNTGVLMTSNLYLFTKSCVIIGDPVLNLILRYVDVYQTIGNYSLYRAPILCLVWTMNEIVRSYILSSCMLVNVEMCMNPVLTTALSYLLVRPV